MLGHRNRQPVDNLVSLGATKATSVRELAQRCDIVHLCVTGSPQVETLMLGNDGLPEHMQPGAVIIDCSTSNPVSTMALAAQAKGRGISFSDSPLSRTPKETEACTLDTMVGADLAVSLKAWSAGVRHSDWAVEYVRLELSAVMPW